MVPALILGWRKPVQVEVIFALLRAQIPEDNWDAVIAVCQSTPFIVPSLACAVPGGRVGRGHRGVPFCGHVRVPD